LKRLSGAALKDVRQAASAIIDPAVGNDAFLPVMLLRLRRLF
jgi:hypothetical protein